VRTAAIAVLAMLALPIPPALAKAPQSIAERAETKLRRITAGRVAGPVQRCIRPELRQPGEIIDGQAIVYRFAGTVYLGRLVGGCPQLRDNRTTIVSPLNGELCRGDPVRILDVGTPIGQCVFDGFTPYTRAK
jgi:hypothetical protein